MKIRKEFRCYHNGIKIYKVWIYNKESNAYIFEGNYTKKEINVLDVNNKN